MTLKARLLFGPWAGAILAIGVAGLPLMLPGYSHVQQTVSEIGEVGSPARVPFAVLLCVVATCVLVFASAARDLSVLVSRSRLPAYLEGAMAPSAAGVGLFAFPHPLHNVFGMSELIAYQAPLAFALSWQRDPHAKTLVTLSWIGYFCTLAAIALNLSSIDRQGVVWAYVQPVYGLAQRALFGAWFTWLASMGLLLSRRLRHETRVQSPALQRSGNESGAVV